MTILHQYDMAHTFNIGIQSIRFDARRTSRSAISLIAHPADLSAAAPTANNTDVATRCCTGSIHAYLPRWMDIHTRTHTHREREIRLSPNPPSVFSPFSQLEKKRWGWFNVQISFSGRSSGDFVVNKVSTPLDWPEWASGSHAVQIWGDEEGGHLRTSHLVDTTNLKRVECSRCILHNSRKWKSVVTQNTFSIQSSNKQKLIKMMNPFSSPLLSSPHLTSPLATPPALVSSATWMSPRSSLYFAFHILRIFLSLGFMVLLDFEILISFASSELICFH